MATAKTDQAQTNAQENPSPRAGVVMAILLLIFFLGTSDNQMISPLLPRIAGEFGLEVGRVGEMMGPAYALAAASAALLIGPISDRFGRRRFLLYASLLFGFSLLLVSLIRNINLLVGLRMLTGLAAGVFSTCSIAYVGDFFPYERRGVAMSVVQAGYFLALVLGVPVAALLAQWQGWRTSFASFGLLSFLAFLLVALLLPDDRHQLSDADVSTRVARRFDNIRTSFEGRDRRAAIAAAFCVSGGFVGFLFYLGSWLATNFGLKTGQVGLFFIAVGIAALIGALVAGPVADRFGKRGLSVISSLALAVSLILIPRFGWGILLFAGFLIASLAFAFRQGPLQALATELVPRRARGSFVAVRNTASQTGIAVATAVSGQLYDRFGYEAVGIFSAVVTIAAAVFIYLIGEPQTDAARGDHRS